MGHSRACPRRRSAVLAAMVFIAWVAGACGFAPAPPLEDGERPPNILVLIADDANWSDFGVYGNEAIRTPNIDRLAEGGLLVKRAFLTTSQCSPSRISMLTGKYPHSTGAEDLHMPLPEGSVILPGLLQRRGYFTGSMKKQHYGGQVAERQFQWYGERTSADFPAFLDAAGDRPFFLWVGFTDPHRPFPALGDVEPPHDPAEVKVPPYLADTPAARADLARYYDAIARMDTRIGEFMTGLERRGALDNTLIIFLSDNGMPFPRAKATAYDEGIRTPLIFSWPAVIEPGTTYDGMVSTLDLAPTLLELAGAVPTEEMQGESFAPMLRDQTIPGRTYVFAERNWHDTDEHIRAVRTDRYKLILNAYTELPLGVTADLGESPSFRSLAERRRLGTLTPAQAAIFEAPRPRIELYDLHKDPWEIDNIAATDAHWERARDLAAVLSSWMEETGDFPPTMRVRDDHTDRLTGVWFSDRIPEMRHTDH